jgi:phosphatidylinositol-3-phosphatase
MLAKGPPPMASKRFVSLCLLLLCGVAGAQSVPHSSHVWMITEENHSFEDVVGNAQMPYYNQLIHQYGLATQFYSDQHSSLPALMWLVAGAAVEPNNDTTSCHHTEDNVVRELLKHGLTWRSYQVNMPSAGFQGLYGGADNLYYRRHNPLIDFSDVCPGTGQDTKSVPYSQIAADFAGDKTANYSYVTPDTDEDAHDGTLQEADEWLEENVPAILDRPEFQPGGDGILFVVWDEGTLGTDNRCSASVSQGCGGRTAALVIGPQVKHGYQSTVTYHNESVLKTVCTAMGLTTCPGAAQNAKPMSDFFTTESAYGSPSNSVVIASPGNGATISGAVHLIASASEDQSVKQTQVWDNGVKLGYYGDQINTTYNLSPGTHATTVLDLDSSYRVMHQSTVKYTVQTPISGVQVVSPTPGETVTPTVHIVGYATETVPIHQMQVWDNGVKLGWYAEASVNQYFSLTPGSHTVTILDLGSNNNVLHKSSVSYTVQ